MSTARKDQEKADREKKEKEDRERREKEEKEKREKEAKEKKEKEDREKKEKEEREKREKEEKAKREKEEKEKRDKEAQEKREKDEREKREKAEREKKEKEEREKKEKEEREKREKEKEKTAKATNAPSSAGSGKFCMQCGRQKDGVEKFCKGCGTPFGASTGPSLSVSIAAASSSSPAIQTTAVAPRPEGAPIAVSPRASVATSTPATTSSVSPRPSTTTAPATVSPRPSGLTPATTTPAAKSTVTAATIPTPRLTAAPALAAASPRLSSIAPVSVGARPGPAPARGGGGRPGAAGPQDGLLRWCQQSTDGFPGVNVVNFEKSWQNGLAFAALVCNWRPDLLDFSSLKPTDAVGNLKKAFTAAEQMGVAMLLDAEDIAELPEKRSIICQLTMYHRELHDKPSARGGGGGGGGEAKSSGGTSPEVETFKGEISQFESKLNALTIEDVMEGKGEKLYGDLKAILPRLKVLQQEYVEETREIVALYNTLNKEIPKKVNEFYEKIQQRQEDSKGEGKVSDGNCSVCHKPLSGETVEAVGAFFHKECFKCAGCGRGFAKTCLNIGGKPYCDGCGRKAFVQNMMKK